jgi:hypothetical protein
MERNKNLTASATSTDKWQQIGLPCLLGAALNILGFGFQYGTGNHIYELAMINWLRDPTIYPGDPVREGYVRFPSVFWRVVALVPTHINTEAVLFVVFLATKIIFFYGLIRLARSVNSARYFVCGVAVLFALSPMLNIRTPFGYSPVLDPVQTQTPLAIAFLVYAGATLAEGRWLRAAIVTAACVYLNTIYVVFMLFAFGALAVTDYHRNKRQVLWSAVVGAAIITPWVLWNRALVGAKYPPEYIPALLLFFPRHLVLSSHNRIDLLYGPGFLCVAVTALILAHRKGIALNWRLELMACSFAIPVALGVAAGEYHLTPLLASLQLMRADSFLFLYTALLFVASIHQLAARAVVPYAKAMAALAAAVFAFPSTPVRFLLILFGLAVVWGNPWLESIGSAQICQRILGTETKRVLQAVYLVGISLLMVSAIGIDVRTPGIFILSSNGGEWLDLQAWARLNTPPDSVFLVPPGEAGFRVNSQRSSWGEWKDGMAVYLYPQFAASYINRMADLGVHVAPMQPSGPDSLREIYNRQSTDHLLTIARENHLQYIVQYTEAKRDGTPEYSNRRFAVYRVH